MKWEETPYPCLRVLRHTGGRTFLRLAIYRVLRLHGGRFSPHAMKQISEGQIPRIYEPMAVSMYKYPQGDINKVVEQALV